jgi:hypothetical protein
MAYPSPDEIKESSKYRLILTLDYEEVADFVLRQLRLSNPVIFSFYAIILFLVVWAGSIRVGLPDEMRMLEVLPYTLSGLLLFPLLLIVVHEGIHIIVFVILGGRNIRVGADLKNFLFYVTAHRHVVNATQFLIIALSPFVIISAALLVAVWYTPPLWKWSLCLTLLIHTTMCAGDIALTAFYYMNRDKKIITWDDADEKVAYFYQITNDQASTIS